MDLHVGIIMDGNGRFATERGLPRTDGHKKGAEKMLDFVRAMPTCGVKILSLYAFAVNNWKRDEQEVNLIWYLIKQSLIDNRDEIIDSDIRFRCLGNRSNIPTDLLSIIEKLENETKQNKSQILCVALNYDGVEEVVRATRELATLVSNGQLNLSEIDEKKLLSQLDTKDLPLPDIIIRTGLNTDGTSDNFSIWRGSGFLQLQSAQAVCIATPIYWPAFTPEHLKQAIQVAKPKARLFGGQRLT